MSSSFPLILNSKIFKFIVGESVDGKPSEFFIHSQAIAQLSKPLYALTYEGPEARAGLTTWKDVSKATFERFVQFAYTGDYTIPNTDKRSILLELAEAKRTVNGHGLSASVPNGHRGRNGSHDLDDVSTIGSHDGSMPAFEIELQGQQVPERTDDESRQILQNPSPQSKRNRKKRAKSVAKKASIEPGVVDGSDPLPTRVNGLSTYEPELKVEEVGSLVEAEAQIQIRSPESDIGIAVPMPKAEPVPQDTRSEPSQQQPNLSSIPLIKQEDNLKQFPDIIIVDFESLSYPLLASRNSYAGTLDPRSSPEKDQSYSNVLLAHASLYVLGQFQFVNSLKALALFKLHKTLCLLELDSENSQDITDLARYAYSKESDGYHEEGNDGLRVLVCQYMALHAAELSLNISFMNLLAEGGQIVKDFFRFQLRGRN